MPLPSNLFKQVMSANGVVLPKFYLTFFKILFYDIPTTQTVKNCANEKQPKWIKIIEGQKYKKAKGQNDKITKVSMQTEQKDQRSNVKKSNGQNNRKTKEQQEQKV